MDLGTIYRDARGRITDLVAGLSDGELATVVPGCPSWTVKDVVGHLAGVVSDFDAGRVEGAPGEEWTARQVEDRKGVPLADILTEWSSAAPGFEDRLGDVRALAPPAIHVLAHEADIRGALQRPRLPDDDAVNFVLQRIVAVLDRRLRAADGPGLRVKSATDEWIVGAGDTAATLTIEPYELFRAGVGRRSEAQVRSYAWEGDPEPYLAVLSFFPMSDADLTEP